MKTSLLVKTAMIAAITAATSFISIPIGSVPVTLQIFFVLLSGLVLGPIYGALSMIIYVIIGILGIPVFSGGKAGIGVLFGPTGGYIIGFIFAAFVVGFIASKSKNRIILYMGMLAGIAIVYIFGVSQLMVVAKLTLSQAIMVGLLPFIIPDIIKALIAVELAKRLDSYSHQHVFYSQKA